MNIQNTILFLNQIDMRDIARLVERLSNENEALKDQLNEYVTQSKSQTVQNAEARNEEEA